MSVQPQISLDLSGLIVCIFLTAYRLLGSPFNLSDFLSFNAREIPLF